MDATLKSILLGRVRRGFTALALGTATLTSGCAVLDQCKVVHECKACGDSPQGPAAPQVPPPVPWPPGAPVAPQGSMPRNACTYWSNNIAEANDPTRGGQKIPGYVGRLVLLGDNDQPALFEGRVMIELWDERPANGGPQTKIEVWEIDKDTLRKLVTKATLGWGYTFFLPTSTYNPNISKVHLHIPVMPEGGTYPLYATATSMVMYYQNQHHLPGTTLPASYRPNQPTAGPVLGELNYSKKVDVPGTVMQQMPGGMSPPQGQFQQVTQVPQAQQFQQMPQMQVQQMPVQLPQGPQAVYHQPIPAQPYAGPVQQSHAGAVPQMMGVPQMPQYQLPQGVMQPQSIPQQGIQRLGYQMEQQQAVPQLPAFPQSVSQQLLQQSGFPQQGMPPHGLPQQPAPQLAAPHFGAPSYDMPQQATPPGNED